ncbi:alpha-(1,3)-fucosyltransferase C [Leptopilina boulardi]|uniref:alpha-(1,3)-fucosyltransferase C n=1 Tax=Leptopilina boulardi TaxID=63433 RepID=UPI0021F50DA3|nr:alpha-(1,3)-fucosyltransferase C [Leptopilina boulardi]
MNWKKIIFLTSVSLILLYYLILFFQLIKENFYFRTKLKHVNINNLFINDSSTKTILFWNSMFGDKNFYFNPKNNRLDNCSSNEKKCLFTNNRDIMNEELFDAILFHGIHDLNINDLPIKRSLYQHYIFVSLESPANRQVLDLFPSKYFNLTMSYNLKSDIIWPYSYIINKVNQLIVAPNLIVNWNTSYEEDNKEDENMKKTINNKINMAIWFRSNCNTKSGRENYVEDLENYINIDKIGNCLFGDKKCSREKNCFADIVEPNYYFYLSFENSLCQDYVTEKFFNALQYNVVPVVYGAANYSNFAPPHSYINALDFDSPKELASYLINLSKNRSEYVKYFRWKKYYAVETSNDKAICDLCDLLHKTNNEKIYKNIFAWYSDNQCPIQKKFNLQKESGGLLYVTKKILN